MKTRIRKEIVQINQFNGFENFEDYQNRKALFINNDDALANLWGRIVLQSTIETSNDYLEARITPWDLSVRFYNFKECIFVKRDFYKKTNKKLGFVVHFIKQKEMPTNEDSELNCRYASFRNELHSDIDRIIDIVTKPDGQNAVPIVGIDAASTEMFCRPEVFAHIYRYAREKRIYGRTYHVGEDFFDLVDGLRAIDEAIEFLELDNNSRIGHGLALSVDAKKYFEKRKHNIIMPKQNVLDCCVWLWMRCQEFDIQMSGDLEYFIQKESRKLYHDIGYDLDFDMWDYWQSMQMRGCDPIYAYQSNSASSIWIETAKQEKYIKNLEDSNAYRLFHRYHYEGKVKKEGKKRHSTQWPDSIVDIVSKLQEMMIRKIEQRGIAIECNPTSNIKIGYFDRYDEHPLITSFFPIDKWENPTYPLLRCSINTDDRGVFATSIYNEYSLIALALLKKEDKDTKKKLYNKISVYRYIEEIRIQSKNQRFVGKDGDLKTTESSNVRLKPLVWRDLDAHIDSASKEVKTVDVNVQLGLPERENAFVPIDNETNDVEKVDESKHVWCIDFGFEGIAWQRIWFERSEEFGSEWVIKDFVMPPSNRMFWVGPGKFQGNSEKALLCEIPIYGVNRDKNRNHQKDDSKKYQIGAGAVGTLRIYDDSGSKNWYIEFIPKQYQITYGIEDGPDWTSEDIKEDISNPFSVQEQLWMMNENYNPTYKYYVGIARKNGTTAHVKGLSKKVKEE